MSTPTEWIANARRPIADIAAALGLPAKRHHYRCPNACGEDLSAYSTGPGFKCARCGARGDSIDFVAYAIARERYTLCNEDDRARVKEWHLGRRYTVAVPAPPVREPIYGADVDAFFESCATLGRHPYAVHRGWADCPPEYARMVPVDLPTYPPYYPRGRASMWPLIVRGYDTNGIARNVHARATWTTPDAGKVMWGKDIDAAGLVFWNRVVKPEIVVIVEGLPDWITMAMRCHGMAVAVLGGTSGSFSAFRSLPIREGVEIVCMTHEDAAGDGYAREVAGCYPGRVRRARVPVRA